MTKELLANDAAMNVKTLAAIMDDVISKLYPKDEEQLEKVDTLLRLSTLMSGEINKAIDLLGQIELESR